MQYDELDGSSMANTDVLVTGLGNYAKTRRWSDKVRIVPGSAEESLIHFLISTRDPAEPKDRMPPIGSAIVPKEGLALIEAWINALPHEMMDAGMPDSAMPDSAMPDSAMPDSAMIDEDAGI
jgi:hypothetical protein